MLRLIRTYKNQTSGTQVFFVGPGMIVLGFTIYLVGEVLKTSFGFTRNDLTMQVGMAIALLGAIPWIIGAFMMNYKPPKKPLEE